MIYSLFEKTISELMSRLDKLISRLEVDMSGINCREILIHNKRLSVLKKNLDILKKQEYDLKKQYLKYRELHIFYKIVLGRIIRIGFILIIFLSVFLTLYFIEAVLGFQTISYILPSICSKENLPFVATITASSIGVLSIVISISYGLYRRRSIVINREYENSERKYMNLVNRINIIEREIEKSYKYMLMPRATCLCKCHVELVEFREKIWFLNKLLQEIRECSSITCFNQYLRELVKIIDKLKELSKLCNTAFTEEYRISLDIVCDSGEEGVLNNCCLKITIGSKEYLLIVDKYLTNIRNSLEINNA